MESSRCIVLTPLSIAIFSTRREPAFDKASGFCRARHWNECVYKIANAVVVVHHLTKEHCTWLWRVRVRYCDALWFRNGHGAGERPFSRGIRKDEAYKRQPFEIWRERRSFSVCRAAERKLFRCLQSSIPRVGTETDCARLAPRKPRACMRIWSSSS